MRPFLTACLAFAVPAFAGTLRNADAREYHLKIKAANGEQHEPINTTTTWDKTCAAFPCNIENEDTGDVIRLTCAEENLDIMNGHFALNTGGAVAVENAAPAPAPSAPAEKPGKRGKHGGKKALAHKAHAKAASKKAPKTRHARRG
jgi:hypothetical protein